MVTSSRSHHRFRRVLLWIAGVIVCLALALFIASFFLDKVVGPRIQSAMNAQLKGYHVNLSYTHLQLIGGVLTLKGVKITQQAHPAPPIADIKKIRFQIDWGALAKRRLVASVLLVRPRLHVDETQFVTEKNNQVPLRKEGWQQALEAAFPFKINRLTIQDGDVVYIQNKQSPPLHVANLNFVSDNIRNIRSANRVYPSSVSANMTIFGEGHASIRGAANYLAVPFPGVRAYFSLRNAPVSVITPEIQQFNVMLSGGHLSSAGLIEYSPSIERIRLDDATLEGATITYVHKPATAQAEVHRVKAAGEEIKQVNNRPALDLKIQKLDIAKSQFVFIDYSKNPSYRLFFSDARIHLTNLSNQQSQGQSQLSIEGKFMGSGPTNVEGHFIAGQNGPDLTVNASIHDTDLPSMNDVLRAYGRFEVAAGEFSLFMQATIRNGHVAGYVKPLFTNLQVYNRQQEKGTGVLHQAKEIVIGAASHVFRNQRTQKVATSVDISGQLSSPEVSTWQALLEVLRNAFIKAILPGFDRTVGANPGGGIAHR